MAMGTEAGELEVQWKKSETLGAQVLGEGFCRRCLWNSILKSSSTEGQGKQ